MLETAGLDSTVLDAGIAAQQLQLVNAIVDEDRQYATRLTITRTDNENASESVISTVISWLMKKKVLSKEHCDSFREGTYSTPDGWNGTTELEQGKTALASKRNSGVPGCVVWAMELDEQDHRLIYGRWHTRIGIIGNADSCIVNIQLSRYIVRGFIGEAAPPIPSTPRIVKMLFSDEANVVRVFCPDARGRLQKKFDLRIGSGSSRIASVSELLFRMVNHSAYSYRTSRGVFSNGYCPWCSPYRAKLLNDIDDVCGDMDLIEGIDLALDVSDPHGAHLTMSHDNDIDRAWIPINYCPICGRNFRKDR